MVALSGSNVLILGGSGFIGHHLTKKLVDLNLDVCSVGLKKVPARGLIDNVEYRQLNLVNRVELCWIKSCKFDYVINLAGYVDHSSYSHESQHIFDQHFNITKNVIDSLDWSSLKKFINIGSSEEYGEVDLPLDETAREAPSSLYSFSKVASTHFLQMLAREQNLPTTTLRLYLTYGPAQDENRLIPQTIKSCLAGGSFETTTGHQLRDFCYIDDVVDGIVKVLTSEKTNGEVLNLASGTPISVREVVLTIHEIIGKGSLAFGRKKIRKSEPNFLVPNVEKVKALVGWQPVVALRDGLKKTVDWYANQSFAEG